MAANTRPNGNDLEMLGFSGLGGAKVATATKSPVTQVIEAIATSLRPGVRLSQAQRSPEPARPVLSGLERYMSSHLVLGVDARRHISKDIAARQAVLELGLQATTAQHTRAQTERAQPGAQQDTLCRAQGQSRQPS